jgi:hypothetical protein
VLPLHIRLGDGLPAVPVPERARVQQRADAEHTALTTSPLKRISVCRCCDASELVLQPCVDVLPREHVEGELAMSRDLLNR